MGDDSVAVDLNLTLLKRDYFLKLVKKFTVLESKIRRHKLFDTSTETIEKTYGQLKAFLLTLHSEFGKTGEILQTFLTGIEQILGYFKLIRPHLQGDTGSNFAAANQFGVESLTKVSEAVLSALSYIDDANSNCSALCGKMANLIVTIPDEKISELMERTTSIIEKLGQDTTRLGNATVKGQAEKAKTKYLIENHVWKKHEIVKVLLGDAKRQIREVKSTIVTSSNFCDEAATWRDDLINSLDDVKVTTGREKEDKCNELEDVLKQFRSFNSSLHRQIIKAEQANEKLMRAADAAEKADPTGQWQLVRIPERSNARLCCVIKGPVESMRSLKIIHRRKKHSSFKESLVNNEESLISEVIDLENADPSIKPKWPLVACIPQVAEVTSEDEKKVITKLAEKKEQRDWRIEIPLAVNRKYTKRQLLNVQDVLFTEVKISSFCTMAVVLTTQTDPYYSLPSTPCTGPSVPSFWVPPPTESPPPPAREQPRDLRKDVENAVLTDIFLHDLACEFESDANRILLRLGLKHSEINNERENQRLVQDAFFSCLLSWKRKDNRSSPDKLKVLKEVLRNVERNDLVAKVEKKEAEARNEMETNGS